MIPILLDDTKSLTALLADHSNGLGRLNAITCTVDEERNGLYEMTMTLSIDDKHYADLHTGSIIRVKAGESAGLQMFRVYRISKPLNGIVTVDARHITYDLAKAPVLPFSSTGANATMRALVSHLGDTYEFSAESDIVSTSSFNLDIPRAFRECLGGYQGSILDVFGGEYEWDNLTVKLLAHRGSDNGYAIKYGKNLTDLQQEENIESVYNAVLGYCTRNDEATTGTVIKATAGTAPKVKIVDFSSEFDDNNTPTVAKLNALAQAYIDRNNIGVPHVNLKISFVGLWETDEYKDVAILERVNLCDTVHVQFEKLGVNATAKVIATTYDVINERYTELQLGDAQTSLNDLIRETATSAVEQDDAKDFLSSYIQSFTDIITNSLGLFTSRVQKENGGYQYYLHNRPVLSESQYQWTINAGGFALSTDYGQTWTAGIDSQGNAVFNSLSANIIRAMEMYGATIVFGTNKTVTASSLANGIQFKGEGSIYNYTLGQWMGVNYQDANYTVTANQLSLFTNDDRNTAQMFNFDANGGSANYVNLNCDKETGNTQLTISNTGQNTLTLNHSDTQNSTTITNRDVNNANANANSLTMNSGASNYTLIQNGANDGYLANRIQLMQESTGNTVDFNNYGEDGQLANKLGMTHNASGNSIGLYNYDSSGQILGNCNVTNGEFQAGYGDTSYLHINDNGYWYVKIAGDGAYKTGWIDIKDGDGVYHKLLGLVND